MKERCSLTAPRPSKGRVLVPGGRKARVRLSIVDEETVVHRPVQSRKKRRESKFKRRPAGEG